MFESCEQDLARAHRGLFACIGRRRAIRTFGTFSENHSAILVEYCLRRHGDGMNKGQVAFDGFQSHNELLAKRDLWLAVLKNTRAGIMPRRRTAPVRRTAAVARRPGFKRDVFALTGESDPGRVTIRTPQPRRVSKHNSRLNGARFKVRMNCRPTTRATLRQHRRRAHDLADALGNTCGGGDHRRRCRAARGRVVAERRLPKRLAQFGRQQKGDRFSSTTKPSCPEVSAEHAGSYKLVLEFEVLGQFDFDPAVAGWCSRWMTVKPAAGVWLAGRKKVSLRHRTEWESGERRLAMEISADSNRRQEDLARPAPQRRCAYRDRSKKILEPAEDFELFFSKDVPEGRTERRDYAREI